MGGGASIRLGGSRSCAGDEGRRGEEAGADAVPLAGAVPCGFEVYLHRGRQQGSCFEVAEVVTMANPCFCCEGAPAATYEVRLFRRWGPRSVAFEKSRRSRKTANLR